MLRNAVRGSLTRAASISAARPQRVSTTAIDRVRRIACFASVRGDAAFAASSNSRLETPRRSLARPVISASWATGGHGGMSTAAAQAEEVSGAWCPPLLLFLLEPGYAPAVRYIVRAVFALCEFIRPYDVHHGSVVLLWFNYSTVREGLCVWFSALLPFAPTHLLSAQYWLSVSWCVLLLGTHGADLHWCVALRCFA